MKDIARKPKAWIEVDNGKLRIQSINIPLDKTYNSRVLVDYLAENERELYEELTQQLVLASRLRPKDGDE